ncbi:hypothetical protein BRC75_06095 [Halobacteriales archaeon QH_7_69_31]|nr:MAG: hypothetical protein BRC75_06095 [Halobacteriales archaeon QH_7_69_31]
MFGLTDGSHTGIRGIEPRIESLLGADGIHIQDPIENATVTLETDRPVDPEPADTDNFEYPVTTAVAFETTSLRTPRPKGIWVRDTAGNVVSEITPKDEPETVPQNEYIIEFSSLGMKVLARVDTGFTVIPRDDAMELLFDPDSRIVVGVMSMHKQPAQTVTTTRTPEGVMEAMSVFGNGMKTWSPERTFPNRRGSPPLVEFGDESAFDTGHTPPDTGVEIRVPAEYEWVYPVAPLAHWLGATVQSGEEAVLETNGETYQLGSAAGYQARSPRIAFEHHVRDILQYTFLLETAMRRYFDRNPPTRDRVEAAGLGLDLNAMYDRPLAERLARQLEALPLPAVEDVLERPDWQLTADVEPRADEATILPFLARDLAVVRAMPESRLNRLASPVDGGTAPSVDTGMDDMSAGDGNVAALASQSPTAYSGTEEVVRSLPESPSLSHAWAGQRVAEGAVSLSTESYLRRLENLADDTVQISIDIVINDEEMAAEEDVLELYGSRPELMVGVTSHKQLTTDELAGVLESDTDFIHYVGHVEEAGFRCQDGYLDVESVESVGPDMFLLNACSSYEQGQLLVENGAIAGVVTLREVISKAATLIGKRYAELLNAGFPIGAATDLIRETKVLANQYTVVGDGNATLVQPDGATTAVEKLSLAADGGFRVEGTVYASWNMDVGAILGLHYKRKRMVVPNRWGPLSVSEEELATAFDRWMFPIVAGGKFYWSDEVSVAELRAQLADE